MKKILSGTVAAIALIATPAVAQTSELHYAGGVVSPLTNPGGFGGARAAVFNEIGFRAGVGPR